MKSIDNSADIEMTYPKAEVTSKVSYQSSIERKSRHWNVSRREEMINDRENMSWKWKRNGAGGNGRKLAQCAAKNNINRLRQRRDHSVTSASRYTVNVRITKIFIKTNGQACFFAATATLPLSWTALARAFSLLFSSRRLSARLSRL